MSRSPASSAYSWRSSRNLVQGRSRRAAGSMMRTRWRRWRTYSSTIAPAHECFTEPAAVVDQDAVVVAEYARGAPEPVSLEGRQVYAGLALAPGFLFDVGVVALLSLERPCCWRSQRRHRNCPGPAEPFPQRLADRQENALGRYGADVCSCSARRRGPGHVLKRRVAATLRS